MLKTNYIICKMPYVKFRKLKHKENKKKIVSRLQNIFNDVIISKDGNIIVSQPILPKREDN